MTNEFVCMGVWDPTTGLPTGIDLPDQCYYIATAEATIGPHTFKPGDWLVWAEQTVDGTTYGQWLKSTGGIVNIPSAPNKPANTATAGTYTKVTVDNQGNVTKGDTLDAIDIPTHTQDVSTITGFDAKTKDVSGEMFENTPNSKAVVFDYDPTLKKVTADVKVDDITITKDQYGQLVAIGGGSSGGIPAEHTHEIKDVNGLQEALTQASVPAAEQLLPLPGDGAYDGLHDLNGLKIKDAFDIINDGLKHVTEEVEAIERYSPQEPPKCEEMDFKLDPEIAVYDALLVADDSPIKMSLDLTPYTTSTERFGPGERGTLTAYIDGESCGSIAITDDNNEGVVGALEITENVDFYSGGMVAFTGLYDSLRARVHPKTNLEEGIHEVWLSHSESGDSQKYKFYTATVNDNPTVEHTMRFSEMPTMDRWKSGVPCTTEATFEIDHLYIYNAVRTVYRKEIAAEIYTEGFTFDIIDEDDNVLEEGVNSTIVGVHSVEPIGEFAKVKTEKLRLRVNAKYLDLLIFNVRGIGVWNQKGTASYPLPAYTYIDNVVENRIRSGDGSVLAPDTFGQNFDSSKSLLDIEYSSELMMYGPTYKWPQGDFTNNNGPDYTDAPGCLLEGTTQTEVRWVTLERDLDTDVASLGIHLKRADGEDWPVGFDQTIENMYIQIKSPNTPWFDANKPFSGIAAVDVEMEGCLDLGETTNSERHISLGRNAVFSKKVFIRIGITKLSNYIIDSDITITYNEEK